MPPTSPWFSRQNEDGSGPAGFEKQTPKGEEKTER